MEARRLIARAAYGPDTIKVMLVAFNQAWGIIMLGEPKLADDARMRLAHGIIAHARIHGHDIHALAGAAVSSFLEAPEQGKRAATPNALTG